MNNAEAESLEPVTVAESLGFVEGPIWSRDARLLLTSMNRGRVYAVDIDGSACVTEVIETGGGPNCLAQAPDGGIWITQTAGVVMASRSTLSVCAGLQRLDPVRGTLEQVPLAGVDSPSDCVADSAGRIWFTDPPVHDIEDAPPTGSIRRYDPTTGIVTTVAEGLCFPNGLDFDRDERHLYVAETSLRRVTRFEIDGDRLRSTDWEAKTPTAFPDGIAVDSLGGVWVAGSLGANVLYFGPDGILQQEVGFDPGSLVTSVGFIGDDADRIAVTNAKGGRVHVIRPAVPGIIRNRRTR